MPPLGTHNYLGDYQSLAGNLTFLKITLKNNPNDRHTRWNGVVRGGENLYKGVRYVITSVAENDKNKDFTNIGFQDFSERKDPNDLSKGFYKTLNPLPENYTGTVPDENTFIADDGNPNVDYKTPIKFPETEETGLTLISPGNTLTPGETYTIYKLGGAFGDNEGFATQFKDYTGDAKIGATFIVNAETDTSDSAYEGDHFDNGGTNFHPDTRLAEGSVTITELQYGGVNFVKGVIIPNDGLQFVLQKLTSFISICQIGPLTETFPFARSKGFKAGDMNAVLKAKTTYTILTTETIAAASGITLPRGTKYIVKTVGTGTLANWQATFVDENGDALTAIPEVGDIVTVITGSGNTTAFSDSSNAGAVVSLYDRVWTTLDTRTQTSFKENDIFTVGDNDIDFTVANFGAGASVIPAQASFVVVAENSRYAKIHELEDNDSEKQELLDEIVDMLNTLVDEPMRRNNPDYARPSAERYDDFAVEEFKLVP